MPSRYFTGLRVDSNKLVPSDALTFAEFVRRYAAVPVEVPLSRSEYQALAKPEQAKAKLEHLRYFIPAAVRQAVRKLENAVEHNLICLDIDDSEEAERFDPAALSEWNHIIYHTISSTPDKPRLRVVVEAESIPTGIYPAVVRTVAAKLSVTPNKESLTAVQPMFVPVRFTDDAADYSPVIVTHLTGRPFRADDISEPTSAPTATVREDAPTAAGLPDTNDLLFLRAPLEGLTLDDITDALKHVSPDCGYAHWIEVGAALHHQFRGSHDAYTLFDEWSSESHKYVSSDETAKKWQSFSDAPKGRAPVTARTIVHRAVQSGWRNGTQVVDKLADVFEHWCAVATEAELECEGAVRIAAIPALNSAQEGRLMNALCAQLKHRFACVISHTDLRKDVVKARKAMVPKPSTIESEWPKWAQGWCFVQVPCLFYSFAREEAISRESFDSTYGREMPKRDDGNPAKRASDFLLHELHCSTLYDFIYDPASGQSDERTVTYDGHTYANRYNTKGVPKSTPQGASAAGEMFLNHLVNLIKEPEYRRHLMDWMAFVVQNPGRKIKHAVVIQGAEGCGKTVISDALRAMIGFPHMKVVNNEALNKGWNEWAVGAQIITIEEIKVAGHNRHEIMNLLKPLITNVTIPINERRQNTKTLRNWTNYMIFTNHKDALAVSDNSRRYWYVESTVQTEQQVFSIFPDDYFDKLFDMIADHPGALRHFFEEWRISPSFNPDGRAPSTKYLEMLKEGSVNDDVAAVRKVITDSDEPLIQHDLIGIDTLRHELDLREGLRLGTHRLGKILRDENYVRATKVQVEGVRQEFWRKNGMLNGTTDLAAVVKERMEKGEKAV